jgi:predicted nucleic acid-binding protein
MRLIVDTNILIGEFIRERGRRLIGMASLELLITEVAWSEFEHELPQRLTRLEAQGRLTSEGRARLRRAILGLATARLTVVPRIAYAYLAAEARARIPRDPDDWPTVAAALATRGAIWTADCDFLGCGLPTWTTDTLIATLQEADQ